MTAGFAIFLLNRTIPMIYAWFIIYGIGVGMNFILLPSTRARYFGRKAFGSIQGSTSLFTMPFGVIAPVYAGWVYDTTGSYINVFTSLAGLLAFATVLAAFIPLPKPPARITDVRKIV